MKNRTPVFSGDLQASGRLIPAVITTEQVSVGVRFGEGLPRPYALVQHERYWYRHDEGNAGWVWTTLDQSRQYLVARITRKIFG
jgi:hypothetical protein